ncbi:putative ABC transporter ATP-binding protein [Limtongia smithiae]|uniref:putative ABC transporter ATP-binding protein n=1 Tax=Limtongia smithiae TaxID=1125753 RepID=UPI0034CE21A2
MADESTLPAIELRGLTYVFPNGVVGLHDLNLSLPPHSRTLMIGANGAGKSTLLRLLAGRTLARAGTISLRGVDPFRSPVEGITYLGTEWASNPVVRHDMPVPTLLASVGGDAYPERRDQLLEILDVDLSWHMNAVSDGERRRVQLVMGLLRPWHTLLLDEVTVDLDVLVRARLLAFLRSETESRPCAVVYASHIFDGLADWPSHILHLHLGRLLVADTTPVILARHADLLAPPTNGVSSLNPNSLLLNLALHWLEADLADRGARQDIKRLTWSDIAPMDKTGGLASNSFNEYFRLSRAR